MKNIENIENKMASAMVVQRLCFSFYIFWGLGSFTVGLIFFNTLFLG